jgi:hypothetical protein
METLASALTAVAAYHAAQARTPWALAVAALAATPGEILPGVLTALGFVESATDWKVYFHAGLKVRAEVVLDADYSGREVWLYGAGEATPEIRAMMDALPLGVKGGYYDSGECHEDR